jgi:hypothetical protein
MAYTTGNLNKMTDTLESNFQLWSYTGTDSIATVLGAGYITDATNKGMKAGDYVFYSTGTKVYGLAVSSITAGAATLVQDSLANSAAGVGKYLFPVFMNLADISAADVMTALLPAHNGLILSVDFYVGWKPATTASKAATLSTKITGTAVTGGAVALTSANATPAGAKVAGSTVTAANKFAPTDTIEILAASVTAFVEGNGYLVLTIQNTDTSGISG